MPATPAVRCADAQFGSRINTVTWELLVSNSLIKLGLRLRPVTLVAAARARRWFLKLGWVGILLGAGGCLAAETARLETRAQQEIKLDGSVAWQLEPRLHLPFQLSNEWSFTQTVATPLIYTNAKGNGNPTGKYTGGVGDFFIEEDFAYSATGPDLNLLASVRLVFPTGKPSPFGSSQYQVAPALGMSWHRPDWLGGVTIVPLARYFIGFSPTEPNVQTVRELDLYPAVSFELDSLWSLALYATNPITYDQRSRYWAVPIDFLLRRSQHGVVFGIGGAYMLKQSESNPYRYIIDARLIVPF